MNKQKQAQINELLENHAGSFETPVYNRRNQCLQHAKLPFIQKVIWIDLIFRLKLLFD